MTNYHTSFIAKKRRRIHDICAKMRDAKERKRLEQDYTPRTDRPTLCMKVVVTEYECATPTSITYYLQACPARYDSYDINLYNGIRHSLGCQLMDEGVEMEMVRDILGHTSSNMTRRYAKRSVPVMTKVLEWRGKPKEERRAENGKQL